MAYRFNPPPNWPAVPVGWTPPANWQPPADWPVPAGWQFWVADPAPAATAPPVAVAVGTAQPGADMLVEHEDGAGGMFGARKRLRATEAELRTATEQNRGLRLTVEKLADDYATLRGKDGVTLDREMRDARARLGRLTEQIATEQATASAKIATEQAAASERIAAEQAVASARIATMQSAASRNQAETEARLHGLRTQINEAELALAAVRQGIVQTEELALLQEAGIYEYKHPLADSVAYKSALAQLKDSIKSCVRNNQAINATTDWTVNNSRVEGQRMVRDFSKLMLRAYNAEADNSVRAMKPHRLDSSIDRLTKTRETISRLGKTMHITISERYHQLRLQELVLTADYLAKVEEEKERVRAERERQRDEKQAQLEFAREKAKLAKEMAHWQTVRERWLGVGDSANLDKADAKLAEIDQAVRSVEAREGNVRIGWVYVISNIGSFGQNVVKIGLTRRLDPTERVRELGDASVPFKFDVHALIFDADAVGLETTLHRRLAEQRVNRVNLRREFFYATPAEVLGVLRELGVAENVVDYAEEPEALEWRSSRRDSAEPEALAV